MAWGCGVNQSIGLFMVPADITGKALQPGNGERYKLGLFYGLLEVISGLSNSDIRGVYKILERRGSRQAKSSNRGGSEE